MSFSGLTIKKGDLLELVIESLASGGQGLARLNSLVIFVRDALPGDKVKAKIVKTKSSFAEAELIDLIQASPDRVTPRCSHFGTCGGCQWQNLDYLRQLEYKTLQVKEALEHIAGFAASPLLPALPAQEIYFYRNKMEFSFSSDLEGRLILGLHLAGRFDQVFDLEACFLQSEISNQIVQRVKTFCREKRLSVYDLKSYTGLLRFLVIKQAHNSGEVMVNIVTQAGDASELKILAEKLVKEFPMVKSMVRNINTKKAQIAIGEKEEVLAGRSFIVERIGAFQFQISANSFFQSNSSQAEKLYSLATRFAQPGPQDTVLDLYSGTGTISFFLAQKAGRILGIESNPQTVEDAQKNARLNRIENCHFICSEAKDYLALALLRKEEFNAVLVDPPRSGLHPQVIENLIRLSPPKIIYVSCNPATLARDMKMLCESAYSLEKIQPLDMFPHTYHIETVSQLLRKT